MGPACPAKGCGETNPPWSQRCLRCGADLDNSIALPDRACRSFSEWLAATEMEGPVRKAARKAYITAAFARWLERNGLGPKPARSIDGFLKDIRSGASAGATTEIAIPTSLSTQTPVPATTPVPVMRTPTPATAPSPPPAPAPSVEPPAAYLVGTNGPTKGIHIFLDTPRLRFGRGAANEVVIPLPSVSTHHAEVVRRGSGYVLTDLGSANGTFLNGKRVRAPVELADGDVFRVDTVGYTLHVEAAPRSSRDMAFALEACWPGMHGRVFPLEPGTASVGRHEGNEITIPESTVSGRHALLGIGHDGVTVTDLGSKNGTFVDGARVSDETPIPLHAEVRFADFPFRLVKRAPRS